MKCKYCFAQMKMGQVIENSRKNNNNKYFSVKPSDATSLKLISVLKCPKCGQSEYRN